MVAVGDVEEHRLGVGALVRVLGDVLRVPGALAAVPRALAQGAAQAVLYTSNPAQAVEVVMDVAAKAMAGTKISTVTGGVLMMNVKLLSE